MKEIPAALLLVTGLWLSPAFASEPHESTAAALPEAQSPEGEVKSALEKAKAAAAKQKQAVSDNAKPVEQRQSAATLAAEARGNLATEKRIEWLGVGMLRAGFRDDHVVRTLAQGGDVVAWGNNQYRQCSVPGGMSAVVAIAAGFYHTAALKKDGTVVAWGMNSKGQCSVPSGLSDVVVIAAGGSHTLALKQNGMVEAWGDNSARQCNVPSDLRGVVAISAGSRHSVSLRGDGSVIVWGDNEKGQCNVPTGLRNVVAIAAGLEGHTLALRQDGTVAAWGFSTSGQCDVPVGLSGVVAIAAGAYHSVALKQNGTVVAWGSNSDGNNVPAGLRGVVAIAAGGHTVALKQDGTVVAWGFNSAGQSTVPAGLRGVMALAAGSRHTLGLVRSEAQGDPGAESSASGSGTGFFITEDGYFITNQHVAGEGATVSVLTSTGVVAAKVVKVDKANDLALLKTAGRFTALPVIASRSVRLGATVATVGFPNTGLQGFSPKLARGEIASLAGAQDDSRHFQVSAPIQPGNSGGALVDERGNVIGVVVATLSQKAALATSGTLAQNVNYAVKGSYLLSFLESVPEVAAKLKDAHTKDRKFEDVVKSVEQATVLVLVY